MDFETQRRKRMEALEEKKRRLDEMKRYCNSEMLIVTLNFIMKIGCVSRSLFQYPQLQLMKSRFQQ